MRPPSASQRKWWGKLVSHCIHCSLLPTSFWKNTPRPHQHQHPKGTGLSIMNGSLWYVSVTAVNVFTSIWSVGEAANWVSVFPGHQEVSLSINTESLQRLLQMLFPTGFQSSFGSAAGSRCNLLCIKVRRKCSLPSLLPRVLSSSQTVGMVWCLFIVFYIAFRPRKAWAPCYFVLS